MGWRKTTGSDTTHTHTHTHTHTQVRCLCVSQVSCENFNTATNSKQNAEKRCCFLTVRFHSTHLRPNMNWRHFSWARLPTAARNPVVLQIPAVSSPGVNREKHSPKHKLDTSLRGEQDRGLRPPLRRRQQRYSGVVTCVGAMKRRFFFVAVGSSSVHPGGRRPDAQCPFTSHRERWLVASTTTQRAALTLLV